MLIRKATTADQVQLVNLRIALQHHLEQSNPLIWRLTQTGRQNLVQDVKNMLSEGNRLVLVVEEDDHIVGYAHAKTEHRTDYEPNKVGFITMVFILKTHRRRGLGTHLIHTICQYFETENINNITLRYVLGNQEAEAFWHHLGFTPIIHTAHTDLKTLKTRTQPY